MTAPKGTFAAKQPEHNEREGYRMKVQVLADAQALGAAASALAAKLISAAIAQRGVARIVLSTGASQFETLASLVKSSVDWRRVDVYHLDEYIGLPIAHKASFRKYLKERFADLTHPRSMNYVSGEGDISAVIQSLNESIKTAPIDVGLIGVGENAHIAFNDPPADFNAEQPYIVVTLNERCKRQQVREGWFPSEEDVPAQAISMSCRHIMRCKSIISAVPHAVKADAVLSMLTRPLTPDVPATMLMGHPNAQLFLDENSAAKLPADLRAALA